MSTRKPGIFQRSGLVWGCCSVVWLAGLAACSSEFAANEMQPAGAGQPSLTPAAVPAEKTRSTGQSPSPATPAPLPVAPATMPAVVPAAMPAAMDGVPCEVAPVIGRNCAGCHAATPKFGATMPLMTLSDFHSAARSDPTRLVYQVIPERLRPADTARRMPPVSSPALDDAALQVLDGWLAAGAVAQGPGCLITEPSTPVAPGPLPAKGGSGGLSNQPIAYEDPNITCHRFLAHGDSMTEPYSAGTEPDQYINFMFMPPWQGVRYARSLKAVIDNAQIVHHWLFYRNAEAGTDGDVSMQGGAHPDGELMQGWAPGASDVYFDPDVAQLMPGDRSYSLELHYNNATGAPAPDATGIEVCVTTTEPTHIASQSWLGTDNISGTMSSGTCDPTTTEPIHIMAITPHMHKQGNHLKAVITRAAGAEEVLHDMPFAFESQRTYVTPTLIMDGDQITTTCSYNEPAMFGRGTNEEMCYMFTLYWPASKLANGDFRGTLVHGPDTCLQ